MTDLSVKLLNRPGDDEVTVSPEEAVQLTRLGFVKPSAVPADVRNAADPEKPSENPNPDPKKS